MYKTICFFTILTFTFSACRLSSPKDPKRLFQKNNFNFTLDQSIRYMDIQFKLSKSFQKNNYLKLPIQKNGKVYYIPQMSLFFSIEKFGEHEIWREKEFVDAEDAKFAIASYYRRTLQQKYRYGKSSLFREKKINPKDRALIGVFHESVKANEYSNTHFLGFIEIKEEIYVCQLMGKQENMAYLWDDFKRILKTVH